MPGCDLYQGGGLQVALLDADQARAAATAAAPVIEQYTGVLATVDVYAAYTSLCVIQSIRLDRVVGTHARPCA